MLPSSRAFSIVVAVDNNWGIGKDGEVPWRCRQDINFFKRITSASKENVTPIVIMGSKTWSSIPARFRPLPNRINIVISQRMKLDDNSETSRPHAIVPSLDAALSWAAATPTAGNVFVIGGAQVYRTALLHPHCNTIYLSRIDGATPDAAYGCDIRFPRDALDTSTFFIDATHPAGAVFASLAAADGDPAARLEVYMRRNVEEDQYLDAIRDVLRRGDVRLDRTGVGTLSIFGYTSRWSLRHGRLPLLTTKRTFWRGILEELLWFIKGSTDSTILSSSGVKIWDGNGSREFLDKLGFTNRRVGDLGPVYGFQWRHWGATYAGPDADYNGKGIDQLAQLIEGIKKDPNGRRHIITAWNPTDLPLMALPPCHMMAQFYVANGELSCMLTQRSADMGLGVPFNIASYALFTRMIAQVCGLLPGELVHSTGDTHVYKTHIEPLNEQLARRARPFPILNIDPSEIDAFTPEHFVLADYEPAAAIKMDMAV